MHRAIALKIMPIREPFINCPALSFLIKVTAVIIAISRQQKQPATPVAIDEIKKFIAEQELHEDKRFIPVCEKDDGGMWGSDYKMAVIGAGPAGMTCAYYLRTRGYDVTVFEKEKRPGGMLLNGIPNFRLQKDVLEAEIEVLRQMGVEFKCGIEVGHDVTIQELRDQGYKAFYLSIGLQGGRKAGVPGEDAEGVESGVSFLKRASLGLSSDGTSDDVKLPGDVVVVGGGNVAIDVARTALRCTSGKVTMLCLEGAGEMPAAADEVEEAKAEGIEIMNSWGPKELASCDGKVSSITFKKCTQVKDSDGRFNPQYDESETITLDCQTVLMAIGQSAVWGDLLKGTKVQLGRGKCAVADDITFQTAEPDIFAGGDIYHGARFAIDAIADGKKAAESMHRFVHPGQSLTIARDLREFKELDKDDIRIDSYDNAPRVTVTMKDGVSEEQAKRSFSDLRATLTEEQVQKEAGRCLGCGASIVDFNRCIGCGLCTTRCKFDAIHLSRDLPHASDMHKYEDRIKEVGKYAAKRAMNITLHKKLPTYQE